MTFDEAFERLIGHEGGYLSPEEAARQGDPGGETKFGISKRAYPAEDIKNLTLDRAKFLYARDYWAPAGCNEWPEAIRYEVFDFAVNSGVKRAIMMLQQVVCTEPDGVIGPKTRMAVSAMQPAALCARLLGYRLEFMTTLANWPVNSRGWAKRIAAQLKEVA